MFDRGLTMANESVQSRHYFYDNVRADMSGAHILCALSESASGRHETAAG